MDRIIILADDLTGAADSGVQFVKQGIPAAVWIEQNHIPDRGQEGMASVINVESRSLTAEASYEMWRKLPSSLKLDQFQLVMKKIDSTLRGNIGIEIQALMDFGNFEIAVVVPAYPRKGRITVGGYQLVHQHLLENSEVAKDPKFPITKSKVSDIIRKQTLMSVGEVEIKDIRDGMIRSRIDTCLREGVRVVAMDSASDTDLENIVSQIQKNGVRVLWVGSAGLAEALAKRYVSCSVPIRKLKFETVRKADPVLVVAGSVSAVTLKQVEQLRLSGFRSIEVDPVLLLNESYDKGELDSLTKQAHGILLDGDDLVISTNISASKRDQVMHIQKQNGYSAVEAGDLIADRLGMLASTVIRHSFISGVVLTGGDIAYRTCKHLQVQKLKIIEEVEEGLPLCLAEGVRQISFVTKAGAFGGPDALRNATMIIKCRGE